MIVSADQTRDIDRVVLAIRLLLAAGVLVLVAGPWLFGPTQLKLLTELLCVMVLATMWNLLAGFADIVSVSQHLFVGVGAYTVFGATVLAHWPMAAALAAAAGIAVALAVPALLIVFRLRSAYFAIATWVVAEVGLLVAGKLPSFGLGAGASFPPAIIRSFGTNAASRYTTYFEIALGLAAAAVGGTWMLLRSPQGLALKAMRDNEESASSVGVDLRSQRVSVYLLTAPLLGMAGALIALQKGRISPQASFSITDFTVYIVFIVIIGGLGSLEGPLIGTVLFFALRELLSDYGPLYLIVLGMLSIAVILFDPRGLWGMIRHRWLDRDILPVTHEPRISLRQGRKSSADVNRTGCPDIS